MGRLIKYELKGNFKFFLGLFIIMILLSLGLYSRLDVWSSAAVYVLESLVITAMFVTILIISINSFSKEMYQERGYLTFTLPVSGNKIVGSKTIVSLIWFAAASVLTVAIFMLISKGDLDWNSVIKINEKVNLLKVVILGIIGSIVAILKLLFMIYFTITASKVAFKKKRIGKFLGFILFIVLNTGISYIEYLVVKYIPYIVNIELIHDVQHTGMSIIQGNCGFIQGTTQGIQMNVAGTIYSILILIILFVGTGYLIDNKIDL